MTSIDLAGIVARFMAADSFVVMSHPNPDGDAVGSTLGIYYLLRALGKDKVACVNDDTVPGAFQWLPGAKQIAASASGASRAFDVAVVVDVSDRDRLGKASSWIAPETTIIVIDHHIQTAPFGDFVYCDTSAAATSEIIAELFDEAGAAIPREAAECLYVALITDTGGFRYANTTPRSHRIAATLLDSGLDVAGICSLVFDDIPPPKLELLRRVVKRLECEPSGALAHTYLTQSDMAEAGASAEHLDGLINYTRNIEGVRVGILFFEKEPRITKVSMRSRANARAGSDASAGGNADRVSFNCAAFLAQFGGGGHVGAAGATLHEPLANARASVLGCIRPLLEKAT